MNQEPPPIPESHRRKGPQPPPIPYENEFRQLKARDAELNAWYRSRMKELQEYEAALRIEAARLEKESSHLSQKKTSEAHFAKALGLSGKVSTTDIKAAFRKHATAFHPDKLAHAHPLLRELAEEKMKEINEAYQYFREKYNI
jgi:DnaJ-domain-containing protein 1